MSAPSPKFAQLETVAAERLLDLALQEDLAGAVDVTSESTISKDARGRVQIVSRSVGIVSGIPIIKQVLAAVDESLTLDSTFDDGSRVASGTVVATMSGPVRGLLTAERTILNFMTHLSGIATLTSEFVQQAKGTNAIILDTRKTLPGWRVLAKYAVRCGGGTNHRMGLFDGCLIKDNHIASWRERHADGSLAELITDVRSQLGGKLPIEIEVDTIEQLTDVLVASPEIVLLDNMTNDELAQAVSARDLASPSTQLEASGGVNIETVAGIARTGVDRISVGALTHSAPNFDLGFDWQAT